MSEIDVAALSDELAGGAMLVDVRGLDEWEEARVPGTSLIPLDELSGRWSEVPSDGVVYIICRSGARSASACEFLLTKGVEAVNVTGGTLAWIDAGHPFDSGPA
jgi:rhodanese-related sulfurtransferase